MSIEEKLELPPNLAKLEKAEHKVIKESTINEIPGLMHTKNNYEEALYQVKDDVILGTYKLEQNPV